MNALWLLRVLKQAGNMLGQRENRTRNHRN